MKTSEVSYAAPMGLFFTYVFLSFHTIPTRPDYPDQKFQHSTIAALTGAGMQRYYSLPCLPPLCRPRGGRSFIHPVILFTV